VLDCLCGWCRDSVLVTLVLYLFWRKVASSLLQNLSLTQLGAVSCAHVQTQCMDQDNGAL
jgi:hypothetical protein